MTFFTLSLTSFQGKNILSIILSYVEVRALFLLLIIILPCIVRILRQNIQKLVTELHLAVLRNTKGGMPGASVRNSACGKVHEEGGLAYAKVG